MLPRPCSAGTKKEDKRVVTAMDKSSPAGMKTSSGCATSKNKVRLDQPCPCPLEQVSPLKDPPDSATRNSTLHQEQTCLIVSEERVLTGETRPNSMIEKEVVSSQPSASQLQMHSDPPVSLSKDPSLCLSLYCFFPFATFVFGFRFP